MTLKRKLAEIWDDSELHQLKGELCVPFLRASKAMW